MQCPNESKWVRRRAGRQIGYSGEIVQQSTATIEYTTGGPGIVHKGNGQRYETGVIMIAPS